MSPSPDSGHFPPIQPYSVLAAYFPPAFMPPDVEFLDSAGGMSGAQFWRIGADTTAVRGSPDPAHADDRRSPTSRLLMLRRWPAEFQSADRLKFIHGLLQHAANNGCHFLPIPLTSRSGETFVQHAGYFWQLEPWMPGPANFNDSPTIEKLRSAMRVLAQFHNATTNFPSPAAPGGAAGLNAVARHLGRFRELTPRAIDELSHSIRDAVWPGLAPLAHQFVAALPAAIPHAIAQLKPLAKAELPIQPCIRDIWHDHILFTDNEVTGLIDFGAVDYDTPATDIARLLGSLVPALALPFREGVREGSSSLTTSTNLYAEALAAYNSVRPLSPEETQAVYALTASSPILAGCNWIRWLYRDGREFANRTQVTDRFRTILNRIRQSSDSSPERKQGR